MKQNAAPSLTPGSTNPMERLLLTVSDLKVLRNVVVVSCLIGLIHILVTKPRRKRLLPVWAPIEIAFTSYIVNRGGFGRLVLYARSVRG